MAALPALPAQQFKLFTPKELPPAVASLSRFLTI
jgi:hypothetical protein